MSTPRAYVVPGSATPPPRTSGSIESPSRSTGAEFLRELAAHSTRYLRGETALPRFCRVDRGFDADREGTRAEMMGVNHATSGAAAWIAITGAMPFLASGAYPLEPIGVVTGAFVCAGAALLPDADHHNATIAHSIPILGRVAAGAVGAVSGGHRHGAHSLLAAAIVGFGAWALTLLSAPTPFGIVPIGTAMATTALVCFAVKARELVSSWFRAWLLGVAFGLFIVFFTPGSAHWFTAAVVVGFVAHLAGDFLTTGGLPGLLWPFEPKPPKVLRKAPVISSLWMPNGYVALPILGNAGSVRETILGFFLALYVLGGIAHETRRGFGIDPLTLL